jgi:methyltransferase (TIGR00027 family)
MVGRFIMRKSQSSTTASGIAALRAIESDKPEGERICDDRYAKLFVGKAMHSAMKFFFWIGFDKIKGPDVVGYLVVRCRYIDDYLASCIEGGIGQLVILGAGFDSRAYRFDGLKGRVKVFEVDHPATQQVKREKLIKIFGGIPDGVVLVPVDFNTQKLEDRLRESGYDDRLKTLFILEGVVYYISLEAVDGTLAFIAGHSGPGSSVIFDYTETAVVDGTYRRSEISSMRRYKAVSGEEIIFGIDRSHIKEFLENRGFDHVANVTGDDLHRMYFKGVNEKRQVAPIYSIVHATVKPKN